MGYEGIDFEVMQAFSRAAKNYDHYSVLQQWVAKQMQQRFSELKQKPQNVLDLGAGTGWLTEALHASFPKAQVTALDFSYPMIEVAKMKNKKAKYCVADGLCLPIKDHSIDWVVSNLMMQWVESIDDLLLEIKRILKPSGVLFFSTLGLGTLAELSSSWKKIDGSSHVNSFLDMHDIGDALLETGFSDPVMDADTMIMRYGHPKSLLQELKGLGASTLRIKKENALIMPGMMQQMYSAYKEFQDEDGRYPATFEIVFGHAWSSVDDKDSYAIPLPDFMRQTRIGSNVVESSKK
jgi:malonyl-CoA O-methyltransferase